MSNKKGIALIMAIGVLSLLAVIATSFALSMRLEYQAAMNYYDMVRGRYLADSAIQRAITELRNEAKQNAVDSMDEIWFREGYTNDIQYEYNCSEISKMGRSVVCGDIPSGVRDIVDEQRKINVNTASALLLENLVTCMRNWGTGGYFMAAGDGTSIYTNRPAGGYANIGEVLTKSGGRITPVKLWALKNYITCTSYKDPNCANRSPVNINTADPLIVAAVLIGVSDGGSTPLSEYDIMYILDDVILRDRSYGNTYTDWSYFNQKINEARDYGYIDQQQVDALKKNCNPNSEKPDVYTTEFCFNSGGYYSITGRGTALNAGWGEVALCVSTATVKLYDIYRETSKAQFQNGTPVRTTWLDSCPVDSRALFGRYSIPTPTDFYNDYGVPMAISNSIKLGFWDDFNSDAQGGDRAYSQKHWGGQYGGDPEVFYDQDGDGDDELITLAGVRTDLYGTDGYSEWTWGDFSLRIFAHEYNPVGTSMKDVAWLLFRNPGAGHNIPYSGDPVVMHAKSGVLTWGDTTGYAYLVPGDLWRKIMFLTPQQAIDKGLWGFATIPQAEAGRYEYDIDGAGQIRIFTLYKAGSNPENPEWENYDTEGCADPLMYAYKKNLAYTTDKTFILRGNSGNVHSEVWTESSNASFDRNISGTSGSGRTVFYGRNVSVAWDDIRIIPRDGNFTSQVINSTLSPGLANTVEWGTITGTVTIPATANSASEIVSFQTKLTSSTTWDTSSGITTITSAITSANGNSIQYKALLATSDSEINETPVLEDVTITYIVPTEIVSYTAASE